MSYRENVSLIFTVEEFIPDFFFVRYFRIYSAEVQNLCVSVLHALLKDLISFK